MTAGRQRFQSRSLMFDNISYEMISFSNSGGRVLTKSHKYDISYEDLSLFGVPPPRVDLPLQVRLHIPANLPTANTSFHLPKMSAVVHLGISPNIPLHRVDCIYSSDCGMQIVCRGLCYTNKAGSGNSPSFHVGDSLFLLQQLLYRNFGPRNFSLRWSSSAHLFFLMPHRESESA